MTVVIHFLFISIKKYKQIWIVLLMFSLKLMLSLLVIVIFWLHLIITVLLQNCMFACLPILASFSEITINDTVISSASSLITLQWRTAVSTWEHLTFSYCLTCSFLWRRSYPLWLVLIMTFSVITCKKKKKKIELFTFPGAVCKSSSTTIRGELTPFLDTPLTERFLVIIICSC